MNDKHFNNQQYSDMFSGLNSMRITRQHRMQFESYSRCSSLPLVAIHTNCFRTSFPALHID